MNESGFWTLIGLLDWSKAGNDEAVIQPLILRLASGELAELEDFGRMLAEKLTALDTREHAYLGFLGMPELPSKDVALWGDEFLYARCVVIVNGKEVYERALRDPARFPRSMEFEALLSVVPLAYELKTGRDWKGLGVASVESFTNSAGWPPK